MADRIMITGAAAFATERGVSHQATRHSAEIRWVPRIVTVHPLRSETFPQIQVPTIPTAMEKMPMPVIMVWLRPMTSIWYTDK